ncbi:MAG TPA: YraN family protein [Opitutaceae bacterium]|nr:YraN family protein [Opitutaceae bacterium]
MLRFFQGFLEPRHAADDTGARAERLAADWLRHRRGFTIVTRNWRNPRDHREELDLVCRDGEVLVFVEVKARSAGALVPGYFAVDRRKKRVLRRAAKAYLKRMPVLPRTFRLDVVEVTVPAHLSGGRLPDSLAEWQRIPAGAAPAVRHFENIPLFSKHFRG